jgi:hypothetical protein
MKGYAINNRVNRIEDKLEKIDNRISEINLQLKTQELPTQGIFFEGQIFDAYVFVADLIKNAKTNIILIDNYVDESVLNVLLKRSKKVSATIYTKNISNQLLQDLKKYNSQYPEINIQEFKESHDRFLIIDGKELYHIGASLKDLGKKWFAFSRMDSFVKEVLQKLKEGEKDG